MNGHKAKRFIKRHGADIFSVIAAIGVFATGVSAFFAGKKISSQEELRGAENVSNETGQTDNRTRKSNAKLLVPPVVFGTITLGSIAASRVLGRKREESLLAASAALTAYYTSKGRVSRDEGVREIYEPTSDSDIEDTGRGETIFIEDFTGRRFKSNMDNVLYAIRQLQEDFSIANCATLNDFYELLGIHTTTAGDVLGWSVNQTILDPYLDEENYEEMANALVDLCISIKYWEGVGHVIHYPIMPVGGLAGCGPANY